MPTRSEIEQTNRAMRQRWRDFRTAAECVAAELAALPAVRKVALIGSVAQPLEKEVPRFRAFRRAGIAVYHECKDVDLAVWLHGFENLPRLQYARLGGLRRAEREHGITFAHHQVELFLLDAEDDSHRGRLCNYRECPAHKEDCLAPGCGEIPWLRQLDGFKWNPASLAPDRCTVLYTAESNSESEA